MLVGHVPVNGVSSVFHHCISTTSPSSAAAIATANETFAAAAFDITYGKPEIAANKRQDLTHKKYA